MDEVDDDLEELSPTSSCHTSHQNNPGLRPNNADFSYHAKPYIPNSIIPRRDNRPSSDKRSQSNSQTRKAKKFLKPTPNKDRLASPIHIPQNTVTHSSILKNSKLRENSLYEEKIYRGEVFIYKPSFPGMESPALGPSPQQTLNLSHFLSPQLQPSLDTIHSPGKSLMSGNHHHHASTSREQRKDELESRHPKVEKKPTG